MTGLHFLTAQNRPAVIGMVHVQALPGTPAYGGSISRIRDAAIRDAVALATGGVDALLIENMHDVPYLKHAAGPEITAAMTITAEAIHLETGLPCGVQILAGSNREALAVALAAGLHFIRAEGYVFAHIADEGITESGAGELLRYRRAIGAEHIAVLADIKKKHSAHALTSDVSIAETAKAAEFFRADGIILTGSATGEPADAEELSTVKKAVRLPVLIGSGITPENCTAFMKADAWIVGSFFKRDGNWMNEVDVARAKRLMERVV